MRQSGGYKRNYYQGHGICNAHAYDTPLSPSELVNMNRANISLK